MPHQLAQQRMTLSDLERTSSTLKSTSSAISAVAERVVTCWRSVQARSVSDHDVHVCARGTECLSTVPEPADFVTAPEPLESTLHTHRYIQT